MSAITGLANIGNTCYLNSCLQVLSHTTEFNAFLNTAYKKKVNKVPEAILLLQWDKLRLLLWQAPPHSMVVPNEFVQNMQKIAYIKKRDLFTGHAQNDLQEFLLFLIDCFHDALKREVDMEIRGTELNEVDKVARVCYTMMQRMYQNEYSELLQIFYGIHVSEVTSADMNDMNDAVTLSLTAEPFSVLSLSLPTTLLPTTTLPTSSTTLEACLEQYCQAEILEGENAWYNDKTREKERVRRQIKFWSLPDILIIDLKRWNHAGQKKNQLVQTPLTNINLSKFVCGYDSASYVYDLYGVCNHSGGASGGHYTATIKNANGKWYNFNDTMVKELAFPLQTVVTAQAYCMFLRKRKQ